MSPLSLTLCLSRRERETGKTRADCTQRYFYNSLDALMVFVTTLEKNRQLFDLFILESFADVFVITGDCKGNC